MQVLEKKSAFLGKIHKDKSIGHKNQNNMIHKLAVAWTMRVKVGAKMLLSTSCVIISRSVPVIMVIIRALSDLC